MDKINKTAIIFPGQGAQYPGMGKELFDSSAAVRDLYGMAEGVRPGITELCFNGSADDLKKTENTQPALYLTELAAAVELLAHGIKAAALAGFSLGEITALAYGGAFDHEKGFRIVCRRGELMGRDIGIPTAMAAILKLTPEAVEEICARHDELYPVNYNCPGQITVSGTRAALDAAKPEFISAGGRVIPLAVSGAFHSPFMKTAADELYSYLLTESIKLPEITVYSNRTAEPYADPIEQMREQIVSPVLWEKTLCNMYASGINTFIEAGPGQTLTKFVQKTLPDALTYHAEKPEDIAKIAEELFNA